MEVLLRISVQHRGKYSIPALKLGGLIRFFSPEKQYFIVSQPSIYKESDQIYRRSHSQALNIRTIVLQRILSWKDLGRKPLMHVLDLRPLSRHLMKTWVRTCLGSNQSDNKLFKYNMHIKTYRHAFWPLIRFWFIHINTDFSQDLVLIIESRLLCSRICILHHCPSKLSPHTQKVPAGVKMSSASLQNQKLCSCKHGCFCSCPDLHFEPLVHALRLPLHKLLSQLLCTLSNCGKAQVTVRCNTDTISPLWVTLFHLTVSHLDE